MLKRIHDTFIPHRRNGGHPHMLHPLMLTSMAVVAVLVIVGLISITDPQDRLHLGADIYTAVLIDLTNADRLKKDVRALVKNDKLILAAQLKADDMAQKEYFAHVSPEGLNSWHWFSKAGYLFSYAGENLAVDFTESDDVDDAWMDSPTHKANILNDHFTEIGIATQKGVYKGESTIFVVQMFGTPARAYASSEVVSDPVVQKPKSITGKTSNVLGETKVISEIGDDKNTTIIAQNESVPTYAPWQQRILIELSKPMGTILVVIGTLLILTFSLAFVYHRRVTLRIALGALLAFFVIVSGYVYLSISKEIPSHITYAFPIQNKY